MAAKPSKAKPRKAEARKPAKPVEVGTGGTSTQSVFERDTLNMLASITNDLRAIRDALTGANAKAHRTTADKPEPLAGVKVDKPEPLAGVKVEKVELTEADVRAALVAYSNKHGIDAARAKMASFGYNSVSAVSPGERKRVTEALKVEGGE